MRSCTRSEVLTISNSTIRSWTSVLGTSTICSTTRAGKRRYLREPPYQCTETEEAPRSWSPGRSFLGSWASFTVCEAVSRSHHHQRAVAGGFIAASFTARSSLMNLGFTSSIAMTGSGGCGGAVTTAQNPLAFPVCAPRRTLWTLQRLCAPGCSLRVRACSTGAAAGARSAGGWDDTARPRAAQPRLFWTSSSSGCSGSTPLLRPMSSREVHLCCPGVGTFLSRTRSQLLSAVTFFE